MLQYLFCVLILRQPPISTLFPYTTLFRSLAARRRGLFDLRHPLRRRLPPVHRGVPRSGPNHDRRSEPEHARSEEHTSELQSRRDLVCRLLLEKKNKQLNLSAHTSPSTLRD